MKDDNWTDFEHPCFTGFDADPFSMTKEEFVAKLEDAEGVEDCGEWEGCLWKTTGHGWHDCLDGRLSRHCDWLKKESTDA